MNNISERLNGVKARLDNEIVFLDIHSSRLYIKGKESKTIRLKEIKSLHTKNENTFLLKLKLASSSLVFGFENHNARDLVKNILLRFIKPEEKVVEEVLNRDNSTKQQFANTKAVVGAEVFWGVHKDKILQTYDLMLQQPGREINYDAEEFIYSLPPVFLRIFGDMNCSINQFFNYVRQSNFFDIRNQPNCIDRMIIDNLRDFKIETNYAVRLNNQSMVNMNSWTPPKEFPIIQAKSTEFEPIYYLEDTVESRERSGYEISNKPLSCKLDLKVEKKDEEFKYDRKDVKKTVDLSKLVYKCLKNKMDISKEIANIEVFIEELKKKYGEKNIKLFKRILPTYFIKV
ncbi:hypothetical protein NGRA_2486 [Nosema granulosis]|uniref:Uncharacterized protein n=1 Tax=Nosema granulosis TaxID=83296 RepID=A0A9P6KYD9_9MICR|nr:hypothetical protein NGRA_2486 [Nosema granulosis]